MAVAAVVSARDVRQHAQLSGRQQTVGNRHAQHRRVTLNVEPVLQTQRPELVLGQVPGEKTPYLIAVLRNALGDKVAVNLIVYVHRILRFVKKQRGVTTPACRR